MSHDIKNAFRFVYPKDSNIISGAFSEDVSLVVDLGEFRRLKDWKIPLTEIISSQLQQVLSFQFES